MHNTQRSTETQSASFVACCADNLQCVGPRIVTVDGVACRATATTAGDVDLLVHRSNGETADARLGKVVDRRPPARHRVERADGTHGSFGDANSQHRMLDDLLRHAAEDVEYVVDGNGKFASGPASRHAGHLCPGLRLNVKALCYLRRRSDRLITAKNVQFVIPRCHCRPAHGQKHPPTRLEVITSGCSGNKYRRLQTFGTSFYKSVARQANQYPLHGAATW